MDDKTPNERKDPWDGEYIGNPWGWKISFIGLAVLLSMVGLMAYRHITLGVPFREGMRTEEPVQPVDSLQDTAQ